MTPLIISVQTVLDVDVAKHKYKLEGLTDVDVAKATFHLQKQFDNNQSPIALQRVVLITTVQYRDNEIQVTRYTDQEGEAALLNHFVDDLQKNDYQLLSWATEDRLLPLLLLRCYKHAIPTSILQDMQAHCHGISQLIMGSEQSLLTFEDAKDLLGLPQFCDNDAIDIWACWVDGDYEKIQLYGNNLTLSYYMLYCHYQWVSGQFSQERYQHRLALLTVDNV